MSIQDLEQHLTVDQRASIAKVAFVVYGALDKCKSEKEVAIYFNCLQHRLQNMAINQAMGITNSFVEVVKDDAEPKEEVVSAE